MRLLDVLATLLTALYPAAVYFGLQWFEPRLIGLLLIAILLMRHLPRCHSLLASLDQKEWLVLSTLALLAAAIVLFNNEILLRLYPACISLLMLFVFTRTLFRPPSMIERFARLSTPELPPAGVRYTRRVTVVWCVFFVVNGGIAAASAMASREFWAIYNGLIAYLLMGLLFMGEWIVRRRVMPKDLPAA